jgi:putative membrane protein
MDKSLKLISFLMLAVMLSWTAACDNNRQSPDAEMDDKKNAEDKNDAKFEDKAMEKDAQFIVDAYSDGMAEISLSERAKDKASTPEVRDLASMMVTEHKATNAELKALADRKQYSLPSELTSRQSNHITRVAENTGMEFDKEYVDELISDHKDAISMFEKASSQANDPDVRSFFTNGLPKLRMHLDKAMTVKAQLNNLK